jgi:uncharacterized protein (TIGR00375 family)
MKVVADLQIHSRFARAVSPQMVIPVISSWASKKGIDLVATGDWTHPLWFRELQTNLVESGEGIYKSREAPKEASSFLLSTEVSSIYSQGGKTRKVHTLIFAPSFQVVEKINKQLIERGANLFSDGRPIVGLSAKVVAEIALGVEPRCLIIPAHAWTPHFSLYGSVSGFDSIEECFGDLSSSIFAIETGLSSDPAMNWRIEELKSRSIVSFSDAHSPAKLGREATVFELSELSYEAIRRAITGEGKEKIAYTIEFYPEEGKYHYTGHRNCKVVYSPNETRKLGTTCPICGRPLTVGVMSRVEHLGKAEVETKSETDEFGVRWIKDAQGKRPGYVMMVPLLEILSEALGSGVGSQKVIMMYESLISSFASEFNTLLNTSLDEITRISGERVAEAVSKVRSGDIVIEPGYDGVFGKVNIWKENQETKEGPIDQGTLF